MSRPDWLMWIPNRIWAWDFTHYTRARRAPLAILDVVARKWIDTLVRAEESSTQVEVVFTAALRAEGCSSSATPSRPKRCAPRWPAAGPRRWPTWSPPGRCRCCSR